MCVWLVSTVYLRVCPRGIFGKEFGLLMITEDVFQRWFERVSGREAVQRGLAVPV